MECEVVGMVVRLVREFDVSRTCGFVEVRLLIPDSVVSERKRQTK